MLRVSAHFVEFEDRRILPAMIGRLFNSGDGGGRASRIAQIENRIPVVKERAPE